MKVVLKALAVFCTVALVAFLAMDRAFPLPQGLSHRPGCTVVRDRTGQVLRIFLPADGRFRMNKRLEQVSPFLVKSLTTCEDRHLYLHPGVNPVAMAKAAAANIRAGRVVSGASTIPMQVARLMNPKPRTMRSKLWESFRALQLRFHYSPEEILEMYMNLLPFNGNIVGVGAAAYFYFQKDPAALSWSEAALLTAIIRSPSAYDPISHPKATLKARNKALNTIFAHGFLDEQTFSQAKQAKLPVKLAKIPFLAPHFCQMVKSSPRSDDIISSLDLKAQLTAEALVKSRHQWLKNHSITNAAAVVLDLKTRQVLAMVGSANFFDDSISGQVNMATAKRSPGSTLKPFLYAAAFDQGLAVPGSMILDVPVDYSGYRPENYDKTCLGLIPVRTALMKSANIPAVRMLARLGLKNYKTVLTRMGLELNPDKVYGLPLALGACDASLLGLTNMYAGLGQYGLAKPVAMSTNADAGPGRQVISREAASLVNDILRTVTRPDMPLSWDKSSHSQAIAWKTGTSHGHRDAWAVGFNSEVAIGVWVGNADATPIKGISGAVYAGPILFDLFTAISPNGGDNTPEDLHISTVEVCAVSRKLANEFCPHKVRIKIIPGVTRLGRCAMHKRIFVDRDTGLRLVGKCLEHVPALAETVTVHPPELTQYLASQGIAPQTMPEISPLCAQPLHQGLKIVSPGPNGSYSARASVPGEFQKLGLKALTSGQAKTLYWFQDGILAAKSAPDKPVFIRLKPGRHKLVLQDDLGRQDMVEYTVDGVGE